MKKAIAMVACLAQMMLFTYIPAPAAEKSDAEFWEQVGIIAEKYEEDGYFSVMTVTIGESELVVDGESKPIDESNSIPYVENGRTMMPVRGIAEAIGAEVSYDGEAQSVTLESRETTVTMTVGLDEMTVNGAAVSLLNAPEIVNDRTMLPVRDVAEALDCEVVWEQESQTAVFTRPLQTKRIIAQTEGVSADGAVMSASGDGKTVIQFETVEDTKNALDDLAAKGVVAEPDYVRKKQALSWGVDKIGPAKHYELTGYAAGSSVVAVIDTGIDLSHSFFNGKLVAGYDLADNDSNPQDTDGHGTHVASTVLDVAGVNPKIKVMPVKVFSDHSEVAYSSTTARGIRYAVDNGADVVNLSLGGAHASSIEQEAVNYAYDHNVAVVAAAGNESMNLDDNDYTPGGLDHVITVSAVNENGTLAGFSNYGAKKLEFGAPGVSIKGAKLGGGYCLMSGTSMASPHVAGVYGLLKAVYPNVPVDKLTEALGENVVDNQNMPAYFGHGLIRVAYMDSHLISIHVTDERVDQIADTSARLQGTIQYEGIIPRYVGARLGTSDGERADVQRLRFKDNGNREMDFSCTLASLEPGTTYDVSIFIQPGGFDYVSKSVTFTTTGVKAPTPEPEPEPEPEPSELTILPDKYPEGEISYGKAFALSGRIKSNYHIKDVRAYMLDANKNTVMEASGWTTTQTYVIEGSALDNGMRFEKLAAGTYYLRYTATDESGKRATWTSPAFTVVKSQPKSELKIAPEQYPVGEILYGKAFALSGRIKSNYHITDVRAYMLDANKNVVMEASGWTTTQTYVIEGSALDNGMHFEKLTAGTYYLKYTAKDESGNRVEWISPAFTVVKSQPKSELRILPDKYPTGTIPLGKSFVITGRIKSNCHITDVRAYILNADKHVVMEASGWTTTQTYVIEHSALDKGMRFNDLPAGGYYLKYTASDESGNTVSWISDKFYVK